MFLDHLQTYFLLPFLPVCLFTGCFHFIFVDVKMLLRHLKKCHIGGELQYLKKCG